MASSITVTVKTENNNNKQNLRNTIKTTKYMFNFVVKEKHGKLYLFLKITLSLLNIVPMLIYTIFPGLIINELSGDQEIKILALYVGILVLTPFVNQLINKIISKHLTKISLKLSALFLRKYNLHTAMMDYENIEKPNIQYLSDRVSGTFYNALQIIDRLTSLVTAVFSRIAIFSIIATINIFIIFIIIIIIYVNSLITKRLNQKQHLNRKELSKFDRYLNSLLNVLNYIGYAKEIRLFNLKSYFADMLFEKRTEANKIHLKNHTDNLNAQTFYSSMNLFQQVILYVYLIYMVTNEGLSIGNMSIYMPAVGQFAGSFNNVINGYLALAKNSLEIQEMINFMEIPLTQHQTGDKTPVFDNNSVIEFKNVSFKYPGSERFALKNMNITFRGDEKLCIVGVNGSGKSTFIKILARLYFPTQGEILLSGININEYDHEKYQRLFAPVFQDFSLYILSLGENIVLGNVYDKERLDEVCFKSGLSPLINKLPRKYDTSVFKVFDAEGFEPSGGEGQRIAIARALYHDAPIFLLDEPTAALDPLAEYEIYTQFNNMITDRAAILITHRLSAVQLAVFENGELVEYGTHKQLYINGGTYTEMYNKQAQFYRTEDDDNPPSANCSLF